MTGHYNDSTVISTVEKKMSESLYVSGPLNPSLVDNFMTAVGSGIWRCTANGGECREVLDKTRLRQHIRVEHFSERVPCSSQPCPAMVALRSRGKAQTCQVCSTT